MITARFSKTFLVKHLIHQLKALFFLYQLLFVGLVSNFEKILIKCNLFYFYFLNQNFLFIIKDIFFKLSGRINNNLMEGTVSQNFDLGPSFHFTTENRKFLLIFAYYYSRFPKIKTEA